MWPRGAAPRLAAYRWMLAAIATFGLGALVSFRLAGRLEAGDRHRALIRRTVAAAGLAFLAGLLLSPTILGLPVQAGAIAYYLYRYAQGSVLAEEDEIAP
ncbi:hypothetical protein [Zavarzinia compransoris]|uniref:hypothetical protein n=1 Tax=Zavarzinia compransoris TaxID=1264899 RepID=UPI0010E6F98D|nr:hypothetical protein [Zavarzinia compransoris]TDP45120.1 hypothetical protein DES42_106342 [Zavarzinia compransoris]